MNKAIELFEQIENVDENKYHKTRTIIFDKDDMEFLREAKAELEALQQPKSCDDCKNRIFYTYDSFKQVTIDKCNIREQLHFNGSCDGLCCDKYESKEQ